MIGHWTGDDALYQEIWDRLFEERLETTDNVDSAEAYADQFTPQEYAERAYEGSLKFDARGC